MVGAAMRNVPNCAWIGFVVCCLASAGCQSLRGTHFHTVPAEQPPDPANTVRANQLMIHSDVDLKKEQELLQDLGDLPEQIYKELHLPPSLALIQVYVFKDADRFHDYLNYHYQDQHLPDRRAFFIDQPRGKEHDLLVYVYWSDSIRQDLRHELTHAILHSVLKVKDVPLWLDEGLAVYFELPPERKGMSYQNVHRLCSKSDKPTLSLPRLEGLTRIQEMTPAEYREAWAWVYFMLHSDQQARAVLVDYLRSMCTAENAGTIYVKLSAADPSPEESLEKYLERLERTADNKP
jgi:hypothetical protein